MNYSWSPNRPPQISSKCSVVHYQPANLRRAIRTDVENAITTHESIRSVVFRYLATISPKCCREVKDCMQKHTLSLFLARLDGHHTSQRPHKLSTNPHQTKIRLLWSLSLNLSILIRVWSQALIVVPSTTKFYLHLPTLKPNFERKPTKFCLSSFRPHTNLVGIRPSSNDSEVDEVVNMVNIMNVEEKSTSMPYIS